MDRFASQLLEVSAPLPMVVVHERLGTTPAGCEEFATLVRRWVPPTAKADVAGGHARRMAVRFDDVVWREAVRGFSGRSLEVATSGRGHAERRGVALSDVLPCDALGPGGTELSGCATLYLPPSDAPASERPLAFVFQLSREPDGGPIGVFVAFGLRHRGAGVRSIYERAHRQLHGRFPT